MPWSRWPLYERVLINLTTGSALNGLLIAQRGPLLVLSDVTYFETGSEPARLDGDVHVERTRVLFLQVAPISTDIDQII